MKNEEVDWANDDFDGFESDFSMESSNDTKSVEFEK
jgi:hypothetical protein